MMKEDWIYIIAGSIVLLLIIFSMVGCVYELAITDTDCWLSKDPIICQKIKDGVK